MGSIFLYKNKITVHTMAIINVTVVVTAFIVDDDIVYVNFRK